MMKPPFKQPLRSLLFTLGIVLSLFSASPLQAISHEESEFALGGGPQIRESLVCFGRNNCRNLPGPGVFLFARLTLPEVSEEEAARKFVWPKYFGLQFSYTQFKDSFELTEISDLSPKVHISGEKQNIGFKLGWWENDNSRFRYFFILGLEETEYKITYKDHTSDVFPNGVPDENYNNTTQDAAIGIGHEYPMGENSNNPYFLTVNVQKNIALRQDAASGTTFQIGVLLPFGGSKGNNSKPSQTINSAPNPS